MRNNFLRTASVLSLVATLSACGSTIGMSDDVIGSDISAPIQGLSMDSLENRTGVRDGEAESVDNMVMTDGGIASGYNGTITFNSAQPGGQNIILRHDANNDGNSNGEFDGNSTFGLHAGDQNTNVAGQPAIRTAVVLVGGQEVLATEGRQTHDNINFNNRRAIVYVPRNNAQEMYAGGVIDHYFDGATHAIFGQESTAAQLSGQNGSATYNGITAVSLFQTNPSNATNENGFYSGLAQASVDFDNLTVDVVGALANADGNGNIDIGGRATFDANGDIVGTIELNGTDLSGVMQGNFYGPAAQTLGATFRADGNGNAAVGQVLLNQEP